MWEIIGAIKSSPEDFVAWEIVSHRHSPKLPKEFDLIANLSLEPLTRMFSNYKDPREPSENRHKHIKSKLYGDTDDQTVTYCEGSHSPNGKIDN